MDKRVSKAYNVEPDVLRWSPYPQGAGREEERGKELRYNGQNPAQSSKSLKTDGNFSLTRVLWYMHMNLDREKPQNKHIHKLRAGL